MAAMRRLLFTLAFALALPTSIGLAHHGFGDYDATKIVTKTGVVVKFTNENPHSSVLMRVDGEQWHALLPSPAGLVRRGLQPSTFATGATVTLKGYLHKKDALNLRPEWIIRDGRETSLRDARPPLAGETSEDWIALGTRLHGGFGSYVALGVHIGLDAREQLKAEMRTLEVTFTNGAKAPCPCLADGLQLATGATVGRGLLKIEPGPAPAGVFWLVTVRHRESGRTLRYTVPDDAREWLDGWNKIPETERMAALRTAPAGELYTREELKH